MSHSSVGRADSITDLAQNSVVCSNPPTCRKFVNFAFLSLSSAGHRAVGSGLVQGKELWAHSMEVERERRQKPEAHNPSEGCRWKTAAKNNRRRETLPNQPHKSLIPPEGDGAPCNPSSWEEVSKTGEPSVELWCQNHRAMEAGGFGLHSLG